MKKNNSNIRQATEQQKIRSCVIVETPLNRVQQEEITNFLEQLLSVNRIEFYERRKKICQL
jgi:hypothetical protein